MSSGEQVEGETQRLPQKLVTNVNMAVAVEAIQAIGNLARGLRTHFSGSLHFLLPILLVEGLQDLDQSVEIFIRLLCPIPDWNEKNVQVQQQVIEVVTYLASSATRFPKKCVVLCLFGIRERVADIKTRAHAMKCLTTFSEAVGPGFVFERLYKIMKKHKNPKVLSEGLLWMVSTVEDFGISHLKLKFSAAATRNATIKILGALHMFIGPDIKGFLTDVKATLLSELDAEYEKNPFEGTSEDISGKITPTLLKSLESGRWVYDFILNLEFAIYRKYGLNDNTVDFIGHALVLHRDDCYLDEPALDTLATNALEWVAPLNHAVDGSRATLHDQCLNLPTIIQNDTGPNRLD
ncbi:hypothetical protein REPUB_Repub01dG0000100 [Reevesia pubescens]